MAKGDSTRSKRGAAPSVCGERRINVNQTHYDYKATGGTCPYRIHRATPWVQLKGYWLEAVGFVDKLIHFAISDKFNFFSIASRLFVISEYD